jgi:LPXTG-motif cell wall-anchored protein
MMRATIRLALCSAVVCLTAAAASAQTTTSSETKKFQVISVEGNVLVVRLPEGTREMAIADDFRFNVDGKMLSVHELKPGMAGTATITTKTTVTPVTVTEVKNGTVLQNVGTAIIVRTDEGVKMFSQSDIDKRGIKIMRDGKPAEISDFRANDRLTATIVTSKPPRVMTDREVQATLAKSGGASGAGTPAAAAASPSGAGAAAPSGAAKSGAASSGAATSGAAPSGGAARTLPKTASPLPLVGLAGLASLIAGLGLTVRRRRTTR